MPSENSVALAYARSGNGKPLVLLHGFPMDRTIWDGMLPSLEPQFDLIRPDLRGFGASTAVETPFSVEDMAGDVAALLDRLNIDSCAVAGHSMGGYVALAFAAGYPHRISSLALIASQPFADSPEKKAGRYRSVEEIALKGTGPIVEDMTGALSPDRRVQDLVREIMRRQNSTGMIGALKAIAERRDRSQVVAAAGFPVILLHGDSDALIPISRARETAALSASIRLVELPAVGHMPMIEAPARSAEALAWLK